MTTATLAPFTLTEPERTLAHFAVSDAVEHFDPNAGDDWLAALARVVLPLTLSPVDEVCHCGGKIRNDRCRDCDESYETVAVITDYHQLIVLVNALIPLHDDWHESPARAEAAEALIARISAATPLACPVCGRVDIDCYADDFTPDELGWLADALELGLGLNARLDAGTRDAYQEVLNKVRFKTAAPKAAPARHLHAIDEGGEK